VPVADTLNVAVWPAFTVLLTGCEVIEGATAAAVTVKVAALLVAVPKLLVTVTVNCVALSELAVAGVVYEAAVAPLMAAPAFFH